MRKLIGLICVSAMLVLSADAEAKPMYAGLKGGVNMATLSGDGTDGLDSRTGFSGGAFWGMGFSERYGVRVEGLYVQKGAEGPFVIPGDDHAHESIIKLDYVEFPVLFTAGFPTGNKLAFNFFVGPTFAFNTTAEVEVPGHNETVDISDVVESFEFGGAVGAGVEYMLSSFALVLDVRYSMGVSKLVDVAGAPDNKNQGVGVMAGVQFPFGAE